MKILSVILGVLLALCGISCTFTPLATFWEAGIFYVVLLLVCGVLGIVRAVSGKKYGINFVFSIISVIAGLLILIVPRLGLITDGMLIYIMASWFILQGIVSIVDGINSKKDSETKQWIWSVVMGVIEILLGMYSFAHPVLLAVTVGVLIGIYFTVSGINMIIEAVRN